MLTGICRTMSDDEMPGLVPEINFTLMGLEEILNADEWLEAVAEHTWIMFGSGHRKCY